MNYPGGSSSAVPLLLIILISFIFPFGCEKDPGNPVIEPSSITLVPDLTQADINKEGAIISVFSAGSDIYELGRPILFNESLISRLDPKNSFLPVELLSYIFNDSNIFVSDPVWISESDPPRFAYQRHVGGESCIWISDIIDEIPAKIDTSEVTVGCLSSSSDGHHLIFLRPATSSQGIYRLDLDNQVEPSIISNLDGWGIVIFARCSPTEPIVTFVMIKEGMTNVYRISLDGGKPEKLTDFVDPEISIYGVAESYDSQTIAFCMRQPKLAAGYSLYLLDISSREIQKVTPPESTPDWIKNPSFIRPTWYPDRKRLIVDCFNTPQYLPNDLDLSERNSFKYALAFININ